MLYGKLNNTINLCVLVALCEETEGLSFPTRSGYDLGFKFAIEMMEIFSDTFVKRLVSQKATKSQREKSFIINRLSPCSLCLCVKNLTFYETIFSISCITSLCFFIFGIIYFRKTERFFADII